jgi:AGZA family xanthine/uracil permease-like MFS transporter
MAVMVVMGASARRSFRRRRDPAQRAAHGAARGASGVALVLILYFPWIKIVAEPVGGMVALGVVLVTPVGSVRLPREFPAARRARRRVGGVRDRHPRGLRAASAPGDRRLRASRCPGRRSSSSTARGSARLPPLALPVALATVIGGIDNTESAAAAGDRHATRDILLVEGRRRSSRAVWRRHPDDALHRPSGLQEHGCRAGYAIATALAIGVGTALGLTGALIAHVPESVVVPVLVFVGLEMAEQAMATADPKHLKAVALAAVPVVCEPWSRSRPALIGAAGIDVTSLPPEMQRGLAATTMLGNGFIVTAMLWAIGSST